MSLELSCHAIQRIVCLSFLYLLASAEEPSDSKDTSSLAKACTPDKLQRYATYAYTMYSVVVRYEIGYACDTWKQPALVDIILVVVRL